MTKPQRPAARPQALPGVHVETRGDASERAAPGARTGAAAEGTDGQMNRVRDLAARFDDGEREGIIATFCECAAIAMLHDHGGGPSPYERILDELHRRYGLGDPRVRHHLRLRDLDDCHYVKALRG